ncbi:MAG: hypothetical protein J5730_00445 [Bacteroidales bacterium]|nr:hypothetical protein [Bacteroidales bacterium]
MKKVFLAVLCAGLFVACGNKNKVEEQPLADTVAVETVVEEPVVEEPVVAEEPQQAAPAKKPAKTTTTKPKTENQSVSEHAKKTGEAIGNAALDKVEKDAKENINNTTTTPTKKRR